MPPLLVQVPAAAQFLLGLLGKNWKWVLPACLGVIAFAFVKGALDGRERDRRDQAVIECNESKLQDELAAEVRMREDAEVLAESLAEQLSDLRERDVERERYLSDLERQLEGIPDDEVSPRTKELLRRLNIRTRSYLDEQS